LVDETLLDETDLVEEDTGALELVVGAVLMVLELDRMGGSDVTVGYSEVGSGFGVDEAPGPSPSQVTLYDGLPMLI
jgi:hypothetical protein